MAAPLSGRATLVQRPCGIPQDVMGRVPHRYKTALGSLEEGSVQVAKGIQSKPAGLGEGKTGGGQAMLQSHDLQVKK
ncbi:MAG: hypothetical protein ABSH06_10615 [Thermodesulfobacteriota bacterium]